MSRVSRAFRITGTIIKLLLTAGVAFVCGLLLWRVFISTEPPKEMEGLQVNDALYQAYEEHGEDLEMFTQNLLSITSASHNKGHFGIPKWVMIPDANQIQVLFRYNNSVVNKLSSDTYVVDALPSDTYEVMVLDNGDVVREDAPPGETLEVETYEAEDRIPDRSERVYDVTLVFNIDLTPDNPRDNDSEDPQCVRRLRLHATVEETGAKSLYQYRRLVFELPEGEDLRRLIDEDRLLGVFADFYYVGRVDYEKKSYGTLCLYDSLAEKQWLELERKDQKALEAYAGNR